MELRSRAFQHGGEIPSRYTCDGDDISPPLEVVDPPAGVASFALVMDDPDAPVGTWDHWVVYDIPPAKTEVKEQEDASVGTRGANSWGNQFYGGPCPPDGRHRYFFRVYALDVASLGLGQGAGKQQVLDAMRGHVLAEAELMATYERSR